MNSVLLFSASQPRLFIPLAPFDIYSRSILMRTNTKTHASSSLQLDMDKTNSPDNETLQKTISAVVVSQHEPDPPR